MKRMIAILIMMGGAWRLRIRIGMEGDWLD